MTTETALLFDQFAGTYQESVEKSIGFSGKGLEFFTQAKVDHLLDIGNRALGPLQQARLLDVGCGTAGTDRLLSPHVGSVSGVDLSEQMVMEAAENNPSGHYQCYDGAHLPFADGLFDLTFTICVMHHVDPSAWDSFLAEMGRVTRPGGLVMVIEHNPANPLTLRAVNNCDFDADAVLLRPSRVIKGLGSAGLRVAAHRYILFAPFGGSKVRSAERLLSWLPLGAQYVVAAQR